MLGKGRWGMRAPQQGTPRRALLSGSVSQAPVLLALLGHSFLLGAQGQATQEGVSAQAVFSLLPLPAHRETSESPRAQTTAQLSSLCAPDRAWSPRNRAAMKGTFLHYSGLGAAGGGAALGNHSRRLAPGWNAAAQGCAASHQRPGLRGGRPRRASLWAAHIAVLCTLALTVVFCFLPGLQPGHQVREHHQFSGAGARPSKDVGAAFRGQN